MYLLETRVHFQRGEGEQGQKDNLDSVFFISKEIGALEKSFHWIQPESGGGGGGPFLFRLEL